MNQEGVCLGLAALRCKYVLEGRENEYYEMLDKISNIETLKNEYDMELNHFVAQVVMAYKPGLFSNKTEKDAISMIQTPGKEILRISMIASLDKWKKTIESLNLQEDEVMQLNVPNHATSISRTKDGKYRFADPNNPNGFQDFDDVSSLMDHVKKLYPWEEGNYSLDVNIIRHNNSLDKPRIPSLPSMSEIYGDIDVNAISVSTRDKKDTYSQTSFAARFDNFALFIHLFNKDKFKILEKDGKKDFTGFKDLAAGLLSAAKYDSMKILQFATDNLAIVQIPEPFRQLVDMSISSNSYKAFTLFQEHTNTKNLFLTLFTKDKAAQYIRMAASGNNLNNGGNPDILKKIIEIYTAGDNPILSKNELAQMILKKNENEPDMIEAAIGKKGACGISNTECVSILLKKVLESDQKLTPEQLLHYALLAVETNQPHLVKLFAETIREELPQKIQAQLFESIKLSVETAKHTDLSILKTLKEYGTKHSFGVEEIIHKKEERSPGILLTIGIKLQKFTEWILNEKKLSKEDNLQQCRENFNSFKQRVQNQRQAFEDKENAVDYNPTTPSVSATK
ncbi:hypothetical protein [Legionella bozemanae]|nr:hypothetical protein [Legionella bozemanae]